MLDLPREAKAGLQVGAGRGQFVQPAEELAQVQQRHGLAVVALCGRVDCFDLDGVCKNMEAARAVGAPAIRVHGPAYRGDVHYDELLEKGRAALAAVVEEGRRRGVRALVEMHYGNRAIRAKFRPFVEHVVKNAKDPKVKKDATELLSELKD